ncbi:MAG: methyltransferase, TIGR04325 family [Planctomycetota bacterium]
MRRPTRILSAFGWLHRKAASRRTFESFAQASRAAAALGHAYSDREMAELVVEKTVRFRDQGAAEPTVVSAVTLRRLWALQRLLPRQHLRVLDFGGAAGQHFFEAKHYLKSLGSDEALGQGSSPNFTWHVVETDAMVDAASALSCEALRFYPSIEAAVDGFLPDIVLSSGTLQCLPNPLETLQSLMAIGAQNLFLTRLSCSSADITGFIVEEGFIHDQGPPVPWPRSPRRAAYPLCIAPLKRFESLLTTRYSIETVLDESELAANKVGETKSIRRGYFCRLL